MNIRNIVKQREEALIRIRRELHQMPETAFEENKTKAYILACLEPLAPDALEVYCRTGIRAVFRAPGADGAVGIRADMDALPVSECTGLAFSSRHPGIMHACGHDAHMAIALTAAAIVAENRQYLKKDYVFLFQPAEETTGGAEPMIAAGALQDPVPQALYGLHVWPFLPQGMLGLRSGPLMAGMRDANVRIEGRSCHGARPQDGADAIVAAAQFIQAVQTVISRNTDPEKTALITFGTVRGGSARNIICGLCELEGTIRAYENEVQDLIGRRLTEILEGLERMCDVHTTLTETMAYPPVVNPAELFEKAAACFAPGEWMIPERVMISEDFSFYQQVVPAFFAFLGTGSSRYNAPLHSAAFDLDESVLSRGVEYFLRVTGFGPEPV